MSGPNGDRQITQVHLPDDLTFVIMDTLVYDTRFGFNQKHTNVRYRVEALLAIALILKGLRFSPGKVDTIGALARLLKKKSVQDLRKELEGLVEKDGYIHDEM